MSSSEVTSGMTETALAETLSRTMHNAVQNQHQSQMTTQASITNVMSQILVAGRGRSAIPPTLVDPTPPPEEEQEVESIVPEQSTAESTINKIFGSR
ncbi:conserved hypothetical protein [Vibrio chagasii]|nr:conserved hypothetical protein [Vibrio chagasii]